MNQESSNLYFIYYLLKSVANLVLSFDLDRYAVSIYLDVGLHDPYDHKHVAHL